MASGKQSRRRRREAEGRAAIPTRRPPARRAGSPRAPTPPPVRTARGRQSSPKVLVAAAAALGLIAIAVVLAVVLTRGSSSSSSVPARGSLANALPGGADAQRLFAGIDQHGNVLGPASAPVTMVEYIDMQCPFCQEFETQALPTLVNRYVRPGKLRIEARPVVFIGPDSARGRLAAIAAGEQNRMFNFMQLLYFNQGPENTGWLNDDMVTAAAASIPGLDVRRLLSDRNSGGVAAQAKEFDRDVVADRVAKTPTIFVGKTGRPGRQVALASPTDVQAVATAIKRAEAGS
jgi:protein-disulfide isomerase